MHSKIHRYCLLSLTIVYIAWKRITPALCFTALITAQSASIATPELKGSNYTYPGGLARSSQSKLQETVSINDFHQSAEGDYTLAFKRAMTYAAGHPGTRILLPCDPAEKVGTFFNVTEGFTIPSQTTLEGSSGTACFVNYAPNASSKRDYVIGLVGSAGVTLRGFTITTEPKLPAKAGLLLSRNNSNGAAGHHLIQNVKVQGYFTVAAVYSISSEENFWLSNSFSISGGGAKTVFYTADQDNYKVCRENCQKGAVSNLSLWMIATHLVNYQPNSAGITDALSSTGVGDHVFADTYIGLKTAKDDTSAGFIFEGPRNNGGTNNSVQILSSRVENGSNFARFALGSETKSGRMSHISARDNTFASGTATTVFYGAAGVLLDAAHFENNNVTGNMNSVSSFDQVTNSTFDEDHQTITIRAFAQNNRFLGTAAVNVPVGREDSNVLAFLPSASYSGRAGVMKPGSSLQLRPAGTGDGSAWGASLNIPNGCCGAVPYSKPRAGDVFAQGNQLFYYDGTAPRAMLLSDVANYSQLSGNAGSKQQPVCSAANRGQLWFSTGGPGRADRFEVCRKSASESYGWAATLPAN